MSFACFFLSFSCFFFSFLSLFCSFLSSFFSFFCFFFSIFAFFLSSFFLIFANFFLNFLFFLFCFLTNLSISSWVKNVNKFPSLAEVLSIKSNVLASIVFFLASFLVLDFFFFFFFFAFAASFFSSLIFFSLANLSFLSSGSTTKINVSFVPTLIFFALTVSLIASMLPLFFLSTRNFLWDGRKLIQSGSGLLLLNFAAYLTFPLPSNLKVFFENSKLPKFFHYWLYSCGKNHLCLFCRYNHCQLVFVL